MTMAAWATSYFVTSLPGIVIQLALIPSIVFALKSPSDSSALSQII